MEKLCRLAQLGPVGSFLDQKLPKEYTNNLQLSLQETRLQSNDCKGCVSSELMNRRKLGLKKWGKLSRERYAKDFPRAVGSWKYHGKAGFETGFIWKKHDTQSDQTENIHMQNWNLVQWNFPTPTGVIQEHGDYGHYADERRKPWNLPQASDQTQSNNLVVLTNLFWDGADQNTFRLYEWFMSSFAKART